MKANKLWGLRAFVLPLFALVLACDAYGQSSSFTYQGRLTDGGTAANGNYDLQFVLFDSLSGGAQVGSTQTLNTVAVSNGVFTVSLDFGANAFNGASRFLEISARPSGSGSFTLLSPRQQITSTPYAVRSLNAASADSVPVGGVPAGSGNYIQNSNSQQSSSTFNISGNGTAGGMLTGNVVNATTQFNLNGSRIVSNAGVNNLFVGTGAGTANTTGTGNTFVGTSAGIMQTTAIDNTFVGFEAGKTNASSDNTFVGTRAGQMNTNGNGNSFFGYKAGQANTTGVGNTTVGFFSGLQNTEGNFNTFLGINAGSGNVGGGNNVFVGIGAGQSNLSANNNTAIGNRADIMPGPIFNPDNATAIGAFAQVTNSNSLVLGSINGVNGATADTSVGIGTTAPKQKLHVNGQGLFTGSSATFDPGDGAGPAIRIGFDNNGGYGYINANNTGFSARNLVLQPNGSQGNVGIGTTVPINKLTIVQSTPSNFAGNFSTSGNPTGQSFGLVVTAGTDANDISFQARNQAGANMFIVRGDNGVGIGTTIPDQRLSVSGNASKSSGGSTWAVFSDERLKNIKGRFSPGLKTLLQLQPIRFQYKLDNTLHLPSGNDEVGFSAQAVARVLPEAVTRSTGGYLQLQSDPILWTMLNAIKEQQGQIEALRSQNIELHASLRRVEKALRRRSSAPRRR